MHQKPIYYGGGNSQFEFSDLYSNDKKMIHIKRYSGSSVLSHLFSQGVNAAKAFLSDLEFRTKVNELLPKSFAIMPITKPSPERYEVVFGIISKTADALPVALPFFSKLTLINSVKELTNLMGFPVSILGISIS